MLLAQQQVVTIVASVIALLLFLLVAVLFLTVFSLWFQATMAGVRVTTLQIIGMKFRKINATAVIRALIMARMADIDIPCDDVERAYLLGADVQKVVMAMIKAKRQNLDPSFQELVDLDLQAELAENLDR